jgi:hypothetical protein
MERTASAAVNSVSTHCAAVSWIIPITLSASAAARTRSIPSAAAGTALGTVLAPGG